MGINELEDVTSIELIAMLAGGYKVVHMKAKAPVQMLAEYDEALVKKMKLPVASPRPVNNVVQTVTE